MPSLATLQDLFARLMFPWLFMYISLKHLPSTVRSLIAARDYRTLFYPPAFSDALFGNFWASVELDVKENAEMRVVPLLEGRVSGGVIHDKVVSEPISGIVLEVGAGSGMWVSDLAKFVGSSASSGARRRTRQSIASAGGITKIYGVEPNLTSAAALRRRVQVEGIEDVYEVVPVGIESLGDAKAWAGPLITPGSVDSIFTVMCLCSIPEPEENIQRLYELLKPGGKWYVYEHVKATRGGWPLIAYQREYRVPMKQLVTDR